jgi:rod shape-determining protein MreC
VVAQEGGSPTSLIGVVDKVYAQNADVLLIIDYGSTISARTAGTETPADGLVTGQWQVGSRLKLSDVSRDAVLQPGHYVVTAGLSKALSTDTPIAQVPADVPIGTILEVKQAGHSQTAEVQPFVNPDRVRTLWVITGLRTENP